MLALLFTIFNLLLVITRSESLAITAYKDLLLENL